MGWQREEVWFDADVRWWRDQPRKPFLEVALEFPAFANWLEPVPASLGAGLEASRQRRLQAQAARRRRLATRTAPAVALVLGSVTMLPIAAVRAQNGGEGRGPLLEDPPSLTFRLDLGRLELPEAPFLRRAAAEAPVLAARKLEPKASFPTVEWNHATSVGLPYGGRLVDGTQLPVEGADWVTWNPNTDSVPNLRHRLYGNEATIRTIISVLGAYREANPNAPRVVVGDISLRDGGRMDQHVSHQNGLDVDVYYPRHDRHLSAPITTSQVDHALTQDLLDRFVAAGAQTVFVGFSTGLHGASGVVVPYPNHENHMHVRFPSR